MHERAIEERVALAEHDDIRLPRQPFEPIGAGVVKLRKYADVLGTIEGQFGRDGIFHWIFADVARQQPIDDAPRLPRPPALAKIGDVRRGADFPVRAHAHQVRIARSKPAADDPPHCYSLLLASAFTAATVIAEPPSRPSTVSAGAGTAAISAALASAAPTKPTGQPMIAAGRGHFSSSSMLRRWNSAVGALPIATIDPLRCGRQSSSAAAERVLRMDWASAGTAGSSSVQITALSAGRRARVIPSDTMRASQRIGAPFCKAARAALAMPGVKRMLASSPTMPEAWIMRTTTGSSSAVKRARSASRRIVANDC